MLEKGAVGREKGEIDILRSDIRQRREEWRRKAASGPSDSSQSVVNGWNILPEERIKVKLESIYQLAV